MLGALPYLLSSSGGSSSNNNSQYPNKIKFDLSALDEPSAVPLGSTGSLCYDGDVAALRRLVTDIHFSSYLIDSSAALYLLWVTK